MGVRGRVQRERAAELALAVDRRGPQGCRVLVAGPIVGVVFGAGADADKAQTAGLSEGEIAKLAQVLRSVKQERIAVVLIEHHMEFLNDLVDEVIVLDAGQMIYRGDMRGMYVSPKVIDAYLGRQRQDAPAVAEDSGNA